MSTDAFSLRASIIAQLESGRPDYDDCISIAKRTVDFIHQYDEDRPVDDGALLGALKLFLYRFPGDINFVETWAAGAIIFVQKYYDSELEICLSLRNQLSRAASNYPESSLLENVLFKAKGGETFSPHDTPVVRLFSFLNKSAFKAYGHTARRISGIITFDLKLKRLVSKSAGKLLKFSTTYLYPGQNPKSLPENIFAGIKRDFEEFDVNKNIPSLYEEFTDIIDVLVDVLQSVDRQRKIEEGSLLLEDQHIKNLDAYLAFKDVPESERPVLIKGLKIAIARVTRPKWAGRLERGGELATLSAPSFLKRVHPDYIDEDGMVENEVIRAIDPDLMKAIEVYLSARRARAKAKKVPVTLGDAEGLGFVLARPGPVVETSDRKLAP